MNEAEIAVGLLDEINDPGCREFAIGDGATPTTPEENEAYIEPVSPLL